MPRYQQRYRPRLRFVQGGAPGWDVGGGKRRGNILIWARVEAVVRGEPPILSLNLPQKEEQRRTVKVAKEDLIGRIQSNMDKHPAEFEAGLETYSKAVVQELEDWLERARKGKRVTAYTQLRAPEDHMEDYRQVLDMLKMSVDSEIELTHQEFSQFVRDDWGWKEQFTTSLASNTECLQQDRR